MQHIKVIFGSSNRPISLLIRLRTWSKWSHVGVIMPDGRIIEAVGGQGVVVTERKDFEARYNRTEVRDVPCVSTALAHEWLKQQVGKRYDLKSLFGIALLTGWDDINAYQCAELVAESTQIFNRKYLHTTTPNHIDRIAK